MYLKYFNKVIYWLLFSAIVSSSNAFSHEIKLEIETLINFNINIAEQPNSMALLKEGYLAVSFPFRNELRIYNLATGELLKTIKNLPAISGITTNLKGDIFAASPSVLLDPNNAVQHGIWRIHLPDETATQIALLPYDTIPRDVVVTAQGKILASDITGRIYEVKEGFDPVVWLDDPLLRGSSDLPGPSGRPPFPIGINGLAIKNGFLYGTVVDYGRIIRVPIKTDGSAGEVEIVIEDPATLLGIDEITLDEAGNIYGVSAFLYEVYKITPKQEITVLARSQDGVDNPAGIVFGTAESAEDLFISNFAFITNNVGGDARPSIIKISDVFDNTDDNSDSDEEKVISGEFPWENFK